MRALENKHYLDNSCSIFRTRGWRSVAEVCALSFVFYLWMLSQSVLASEHDASKSYSSLWLSPIEGQEAEALTEQEQEDFSALQLRTHVSIQVVGPISRVSVKQEFYNPSDLWVEGEYSYPLPETAAVDQLRLHIGDRVVEGQVQEKKQAAKTFAKARKEGKKASLLSHRRSNRFRTQLTNIGPNESVTVEFEYQQWLDYKAGQYDLRFPMVSTPTYTSTVEEGSRASLQKGFVFPENHYRRLAEKAGNPLSVTLDIDAGIPINAPESNSHQVRINKIDSSRYQIVLTGKAELSNRDFLISWQPEAASQSTVTVLHEPSSDDSGEDQYGLLMVMPPQEKFAEDDSQDRNLVLVLDVSGSMQGASIQQAKAAMLKALDQLEEDDFFNLIWFNNRAMSLFPISQQASARNLSIARHKVNQLNANGG
ncbi:VIT domain-containing protein, partial [Oleiphilus sp. HI0043]|uniref:VIT domain-containing protein n=3 Tax=unclassified Oleiphilus TaxID=2631174 RepID=UPI0018D4393F